MKPSFNIINNSLATNTSTLFLNISEQCISIVELDIEKKIFSSILVYHFDTKFNIVQNENSLITFFDEVIFLKKQFIKIYIIWQFPQSVLIPSNLFDKNTFENILNVIFGKDNTCVLKFEQILNFDMYNTYKISNNMYSQVETNFPLAIHTHQSSSIVQLLPKELNLLYCNFNNETMTVMLRIDNKLQAIQYFKFSTKEDAIYYLLNMCQSFNANINFIQLFVSGMIEESSNLYKEILKYFSVINFLKLPQDYIYNDEIKNYPEHYFSHLFSTAICVL